MNRVFVDSSVFFSSAYSAHGHSRDLLLMAARQEITLALSPLVLEETRRNLARIVPEVLPALDRLLTSIHFEIIVPSKDEVGRAAEHVFLKDAPIIAAAKIAMVDMLVTLDKKHLLDKPELVKYVGLPIITPKEAVEMIRR